MTKPVLVLGGGGHASVVLELLRLTGYDVIGYLAPQQGQLPISWLGEDDSLSHYSPKDYFLALGVGSVEVTLQRKLLFKFGKDHGFDFVTLIHPFSSVSSSVILGEGVQIMAGTVLQAGCEIGDNVLINTSASLDHQCIIGAHSHIATGVTLSGGVCLGQCCHVGTGAAAIQGISLGENSFIAAGAVVTRSWPADSRLLGIPAKNIIERASDE